jgi:integrase/recombinase XerD
MTAALRILQRTRDDDALVASFILGRPASTQRIYTGEVRSFLRWANKSSLNVVANDLRGYIESCRRQKLAPATIHRKAVIIKAFFAFLQRENEILEDPLQFVEAPPCPPPGQPRTLTSDSAKSFFGMTGGHSMASIRDRAMFLLMSATGLRISEVVGLSVRDVADADEKDWKSLRIVGKGQKERVVHVSPEVWSVVLAYISRRQDQLEGSAPLFAATARAKPIKPMANDGRLSDSSVYERFKRLAKMAGLSPEASPHSLRHFFACEADAAGASVEAIRLALGHAGLGTTQKYLNRVRRGINEAFAKIRPPKVS